MVYDSYQPRLFALVPPGSRVLDVGCGTGRMGHLLRSQKGCSVVGVEVEKDSVAQASTLYDRVIRADLDAVDQLDLPEDSFDCVILGDVLEHIKDPPRLLSLAARHLAPGGFLLVSTPNVAHWRTRLGLLAGRFNYGRRGVLDETHVHLYTLDTFRRLEFGVGVAKVEEQYGDQEVQAAICQEQAYLGLPCFINNGWQAPISLRIVQETTRFAEFGPLAGSTFAVGVTAAPGIGGFLQRTTVDADLRKYMRLGGTTALLALRGRGFYSTGDNPDYFYFGGNMELRGFPYLSFAGNQGFFANAEFRLPLIHLAATPIGILGPLRGSVYFGIGGAKFKGQPYSFSTSEPGYSYVEDPIYGTPVSGWRLQDGRASWGFGLQLFFLGYPMHFDWTKLTDLKVASRNTRFDFWIGFDF